jgi:thiosulfate dehydrogenase
MKFILGVIVGIILVAVVGLGYFRFGFAPVATSAAPMPFESTLAGWALHARIEREMPAAAPITADPANLAAGAHIYAENCAMCHGLPENRLAPFHEAMAPHPPQLFQGGGVTDDPAGETYWKVTNGIRMTGMPAFGHILSEDQRWQVTLALSNANKLPVDVLTYLKTAELPK